MFSYIIKKINRTIKVNKLNSKLITSILAYLIITPIDAILYLQWINSMNNYKWIAGCIIYPLFGLLYFAIPTCYEIYKNKINKSISKKELLEVGLMDSLGSVMTALTIPYISIMLNVVISKLVLPMTMVVSYCYLHKQYLWTHYFGVIITIFGVISAAVPKIIYTETQVNYIAIVIFTMSLVPAVLSFIIKEIYLKKHKQIDVCYMNTIISIFQLLFGCLFLPLIMVPIKEFNLKPKDFFNYISNSLKCQFCGINSEENDNCKLSFVYLMSFQLFGSIANYLMFVIIKEGSSVMFIITNTLRTPITAMMGFFLIYYNMIKFTEGESFIFTWFDIISLILIVIGSIFYSLNKEIEPEQDENDKNDDTLNIPLLKSDDLGMVF
jgi:hypothetical protein